MSEGRKADQGKPRWGLFPWRAAGLVVKVLEFGAREYGAHNWRHVENADERYGDALERHLTAWRQGERVDAKSGLPHLAHAACNVLFLAELEASRQLREEVKTVQQAVESVVSRMSEASATKEEVTTRPIVHGLRWGNTLCGKAWIHVSDGSKWVAADDRAHITCSQCLLFLESNDGT